MSNRGSDYTIVIALVCWHKPRVHDDCCFYSTHERFYSHYR